MAKGLKSIPALLTATALFICCSAAVYAEPKNTNKDIIYSSNGEENIYISEDKFLYNFTGDDPGVSICGYVGDETELSLPFIIKGREVSAIDKGSFENDKKIASVTIPNSIKSIGEHSFNGCVNLKTVNLSAGISHFNNVFCDCPALTRMTFPQGVTTILESFRRCKALSHVKFARSIVRIDEHSFSDCVSLRKIEWPGGLIKLDNAFDGCTALESVAIPDGVLLINGAFDGCTSLNKVTFPDTLLYITGGFCDCSSLENVELPEKLLFINNAFNNCENLSKLKSEESTNISDTAFNNCPKLVIEKENEFLWPTLGWLTLVVLMGLTGYMVYRKLTSIANGFTREKNM